MCSLIGCRKFLFTAGVLGCGIAATCPRAPAQEPTRVVKDIDAPRASTEVIPPVDLGATLETIPEGLTVIDVDTASPLRDAGVKPGDLIKSAAGQNILTPEGLFRILNDFDGGATVPLIIARNGKELEKTLTLPAGHKKVKVDTAANIAPSAPQSRSFSRMSDAELLREVLANQQRQQAQLNYLYNAVQQLAQTAGLNPNAFGAYPGGFGFGPGLGFGAGAGGNGNGCFCALATDAQGHAVIGFFQDGTAAGIVGFDANQVPILAPTTIATQTGSTTSTGAIITDRNGDGLPDGPDLDKDGFPPASNTGAAGTANSCACPLGTDASGNAVIGVTQQGAALAVVGTNATGAPLLAETTFTFPTGTAGNPATTPQTATQTRDLPPPKPIPRDLSKPNSKTLSNPQPRTSQPLGGK